MSSAVIIDSGTQVLGTKQCTLLISVSLFIVFYRFYRRRRSPSPPADEATCDRRTVFVMQLSARLRSSELESFFSQAGKVRAARIIEDRNTGRSKG